MYTQQSHTKQHQSLPFDLVLEHSTHDQFLNNSGHPLADKREMDQHKQPVG